MLNDNVAGKKKKKKNVMKRKMDVEIPIQSNTIFFKYWKIFEN